MKVRAYDTPQLYREDLLEQIRALEAEIEEIARSMVRIESGLPMAERARLTVKAEDLWLLISTRKPS